MQTKQSKNAKEEKNELEMTQIDEKTTGLAQKKKVWTKGQKKGMVQSYNYTYHDQPGKKGKRQKLEANKRRLN